MLPHSLGVTRVIFIILVACCGWLFTPIGVRADEALQNHSSRLADIAAGLDGRPPALENLKKVGELTALLRARTDADEVTSPLVRSQAIELRALLDKFDVETVFAISVALILDSDVNDLPCQAGMLYVFKAKADFHKVPLMCLLLNKKFNEGRARLSNELRGNLPRWTTEHQFRQQIFMYMRFVLAVPFIATEGSLSWRSFIKKPEAWLSEALRHRLGAALSPEERNIILTSLEMTRRGS